MVDHIERGPLPLEPEAIELFDARELICSQTSIAISLKRIADTFCGGKDNASMVDHLHNVAFDIWSRLQ